MFATVKDHCPVHFLKAYTSHRSESANTPESPFYLGIKHKCPSEVTVRYINSPMGRKNTIANFMKRAAEASGITAKRVTNHSARKTMIQRLVDSKFSSNEVAQLSGHKNLKSLDSYMSVSNDTQRDMSLSLSHSNRNPLQDNTNDIPAHSNCQSLSCLFNIDIMTGCTFNIAINNYSTPQALPPNPKRRRIVIEDDSD